MIQSCGPVGVLAAVVREVEAHVAGDGWDQPARLFALVDTAQLAEREPALAHLLAPAAGTGGQVVELTSVEQQELPDYASLEGLLAGIAWPADVRGVALVVERIVLPASAERDLPADESAALEVLTAHPERREVRLVVAALRDGTQASALRARGHDGPDELITGPDLVPGLAQALAATLRD